MTDYGSTWPQDRLDVLTRMWSEGSTQLAIAEKLSTSQHKVTASMIAGQISRLGISRTNTAVLAREQAELDRVTWLERKAMEREHEEIIATHRRRSGDAKICTTIGCHGPRQPGHKHGHCSTCDQAAIASRAAA